MSIFHFAFNVSDLDATRAFYGGLLGCTEGRSTDTWVDFDFFGHQLSCHLGPLMAVENTGRVGDHMVPMPHFGVVLEYDDWRALADRLSAEGVAFELEPQTRFPGESGEQSTMFFRDPSGNPIEVKGLASMDRAFAR
ncbi:VOC family protein [Sulfitobacter albidus]|uniref:VOC family protein n=1 Tax=Sulfitobacter albidus TaxID=2829501 RepID=A0A975JDR7_9RHOB|nr:VOC family protein [Sulfitobacter albidus]QUJ76606.1 VOC family protein [Sulfitobacter albidus]